MRNLDKYISVITDKISTLNPCKIIIFGSGAQGFAGEHSDIDLLVVTNDNFMPKSFSERTEIYLKVMKEISDVASEIPVDLLVFTKPMYDEFLRNDSAFSKELSIKGKVIYEGHHKALA
jgi:uncharacterized protein